MRRSEFCRSRRLSFGTLNRHLKEQRWKRKSRVVSSAGRLVPVELATRKSHDAIAKGLREGQERGVVRNDIDANETATLLIAAYEGYVVLGKSSHDARTMQSGQRRVNGHLESLRLHEAGGEWQAADSRPFVGP
jgi:hypothetical protein